MKKCPKCGNIKFYSNAHIVQKWEIDYNEEFIRIVDDDVAIAHYPNDDDLWKCTKCGFETIGEKFNI